MSILLEKIYSVVSTIPRGKVMTYKQVAELSGNPKASRAVGYAMRTNTDTQKVPCHRVVGSDGKLVGYSGIGGITKKIEMLKNEGVIFNGDKINLKESQYKI